MYYFDGMCEVCKCWLVVECIYLVQFSCELIEFVVNCCLVVVELVFFLLGSIEFSLVGENEFEELFVIISMISKNELCIICDLFVLNQCLFVICGGIKVDDVINLVGLIVLIQIFCQVMCELLVDMCVKLIIYKLFDWYVLFGLEEFYQEFNIELVCVGVLLQLCYGVVCGILFVVVGNCLGVVSGVVQSGGEVLVEDVGNLFNILYVLFMVCCGGYDLVGGGSVGLQVIFIVNELFGVFSVLQNQLVSQGLFVFGVGSVSVSLGVVIDFDIVYEVVMFKEYLFNQIGLLCGECLYYVLLIDEDIIDLVGMFFEFIFEDCNFLLQMQVLLV